MAWLVNGALEFLTMDEHFWLSPHANWESVRDPGPDGVLKPHPRHLIHVVWITAVMLIARRYVEQFVGLPIGTWFKVPNKKNSPPEANDILEKAYKKGRKPSEEEVLGLAKRTDKTERDVQRWFRKRRLVNRPVTMTKFTEGVWRFMCYFSLLVTGMFLIPRKPYWKDTNECWTDYPQRGITNDIFWYYMVELSFYTSLSISQFYDIKRSDFWEMLTHHVATIMLISFSYITNYVAVGSMIMFVHDWADPWLELAKLISYMKQPKEGRTIRQTIGDSVFVLFMAVFWYSRVYFYPLHCIHSTWVEMRENLGPEVWPMHRVFNGLLITLWVLHVFWSYQIFRVLKASVLSGGVSEDVRSDNEDEDPDTPKHVKQTIPVPNGMNHTQ